MAQKATKPGFSFFCANFVVCFVMRACLIWRLQCFDAVGWAAGRASGLLKNKSGGVLAWLSVWSEVQTCTCPADATATHYLLLQ